MGKPSRDKGKRGEREAAHELEKVLGVVARRGQQFAGGVDSPDVVHSIPGVHIEVKRTEKLCLTAALEQAVADAGDQVPTILHRKNKQPWLAIVRLDDLPRFVSQVYLAMAENN